MSAIAGVVNVDGSDLDADWPARMKRSLDLFGRDGGCSLTEGAAGFVVQRTDFTPEDRFDRQPCRPRGDDVLIMDGRIDNRSDLIARLGTDPAEAMQLADSELVARIWAREGQDCLAGLVGDFVIAHWSRAGRRLTCARGSTRGRMLFFHHGGQRFCFASALQGLFALPEVPREIDEAALADHLLYNLSDGATLYRDIGMLPPYGWLTIDPGGLRQGLYWQADPGRRRVRGSEAQVWEELSDLFAQVVRAQLRAAKPVGIIMSGGLDSAAVAGQAARILAETGDVLHGYTRVPDPEAPRPDPPRRFSYDDETERVQAIAAMHPNLRPNLVSAGNVPMLDDLHGLHAADQWAFRESMSFTTGNRELYRRAARDGVTILLAGSMGNSTISHNGWARIGTLLKTGRWLTLARELHALKRHRGAAADLLREEVVEGVLPPALVRWYRGRRGRAAVPWQHFSLIAPDFAAETGAAARWNAGRSMKTRTRSSFDHRWQPLSSNVYGYEPGLMAQFGIERRDPTGDRRLIEFCLALGDEYFLKDGIERRLVRRGLAHLMPSEIANSRRRGRQDTDWPVRVQREKAAIEQVLRVFADDPQLSRYLDVAKMQAALRRFDDLDWGNATLPQVVALKQGLLGGIAVGQFVRWVSGRN